jgi:hypothetical protein
MNLTLWTANKYVYYRRYFQAKNLTPCTTFKATSTCIMFTELAPITRVSQQITGIVNKINNTSHYCVHRTHKNKRPCLLKHSDLINRTSEHREAVGKQVTVRLRTSVEEESSGCLESFPLVRWLACNMHSLVGRCRSCRISVHFSSLMMNSIK